jgi:uncharacterized membrane protein YraQ (UPF0718 family)
VSERSGPILAQVTAVITEALRCHHLTTVTAESKPSSTVAVIVAVPEVPVATAIFLRDALRAKLAFYFANALIRPSVFGLPQPDAKS